MVSSRGERKRSARAARCPAAAEPLEPRRLLAAVAWDGGGDGTNWTDPLNWGTDALPGPADDVTIDPPGLPVTVRLASGTQVVHSVTCADSFLLTGGTLSVAAASTFAGPFQLAAAFNVVAELTGAGDVTLAGSGGWFNGYMSGTGHTVIAPGATFTAAGGNGLTRALDVAGTLTISDSNRAFNFGRQALPGVGTIHVLPGGQFGLFSHVNVAGTVAGHAIVNDGTIYVAGTVYSYPGIAWTNNGTIRVASTGSGGAPGIATTFELDGPLAQNGAIDLPALATLQVGSGGGTYAPGSTLAGEGSLYLVLGGTNAFAPGTLAVSGTLRVADATATFAGPTTVGNLFMDSFTGVPGPTTGTAVVGGPGGLTVTGTFTWNAGTVAGPGHLIVADTATLFATNVVLTQYLNLKRVLRGTLDLAGVGTFTVPLTFGAAGSPDVGALNVLADALLTVNADVARAGTAAGQAITVRGTLRHSGTATATLTDVSVNNYGRVTLTAGGIAFAAGSAFLNAAGGTATASAGSVVTFASTNGASYQPGSVLSGAGGVAFAAGAHALGPGTFAVTGPVAVSGAAVSFDAPGQSVGPLTVSAGTLAGAGDVTLSAGGTWSGGTMAGAGRTVVPAGQALAVSGTAAKALARALDLAGTANYSGTGLTFGSAAAATPGALNVLATGALNLTGSASVATAGAATGHAINNAGAVTRSTAGTSAVAAGVALNNAGVVTAAAGTLQVNSANAAPGGVLAAGGRYVVATGAALNFAAPLVESNGDLEVQGTGAVSGLTALRVNRGRLALRGGAARTIVPAGGTFRDEGQFDLGPGTLLGVTGNVALGGTAGPTVRVELSGTNAVSVGRLDATGTIDLASPDAPARLEARLTAGYNPPAGTRFDVVTAGAAVAGAFDQFSTATTPGGLALLATRPNARTLALVAGTPPAAPPRAGPVTFDAAGRQAVVVPFDQDVSASVSRADLRLYDAATWQPLPTSVGTFAYDPATNVATLLLTGQLPDGRYRLAVRAAGVFGPGGTPMTAGPYVDFALLAGDADGDGAVGLNDLLTVSNHYADPAPPAPPTRADGDLDGDGAVGLSDLLLLSNHYGTQLPPTPPPPPGLFDDPPPMTDRPAPAPAAAAPTSATAAPVPAATIAPATAPTVSVHATPTPSQPARPDRTPGPSDVTRAIPPATPLPTKSPRALHAVAPTAAPITPRALHPFARRRPRPF